MSSHRIQRVNALIQRELSQHIQRQLRDPRLTVFLHVTAVETAPDLSFARVFVSSAEGEPGDREKALAVLKSAAGHLRTELARAIRLRRMPELFFQWDDSIERGDRILKLLDQVSHESDSDEEHSPGD
jgi:ribosome-binding factor A